MPIKENINEHVVCNNRYFKLTKEILNTSRLYFANKYTFKKLNFGKCTI